MLTPQKKIYDKPRQCSKKQRHHFANTCPSCQSDGFPLVMHGCELDHEGWSKNKELMPLNFGEGGDFSVSLGLQGIKPVIPKGNQS